MNKTEIKSRLKEIVDVAKATVKSLEEKNEWLSETIEKIEQLEDHLLESEMEDMFDKDELIQDISNRFFERELEDVFYMTDDLIDDITEYNDGLSELKSERFLEKYGDLELVLEKFSQGNAEYDTVENAIEHIEEAIDMLKDMY